MPIYNLAYWSQNRPWISWTPQSNSHLIQMTTYKISTPWPTPREPWANTIAYLPMKTDLLDHSGTWTTATVSWTVSLTDWHWYFNGGKIYGSLSSIPTSYTISMWLKATSLPAHWKTITCIWQYNSHGNFWFWLRETYNNFCYSRRDADYPTWPIADTTNWYLATITYTSWTVALYINWTYNTGTSAFPTTALWTSDYIISDSFGANFYWYINDYIVEDKVWTAQEVSDYYNSTKSNYGL